MLKLYRIIPAGTSAPLFWLGQFADENHALAEYNAEVRRERTEGIHERPELEFVEGLEREAEYYLTEEEVTHTRDRRDEAFESARWGLARRSGTGR
jgi:hypothetical protein